MNEGMERLEGAKEEGNEGVEGKIGEKCRKGGRRKGRERWKN